MARSYKIFDHSQLKTSGGSPIKDVKATSSLRENIKDDLVRSIDSTIKYIVTGEGSNFSDPTYGTILKYLIGQNISSEEILTRKIVERVIPKVNNWLNNQTTNLVKRVDLLSAKLVSTEGQLRLVTQIALYDANNTQVLYELRNI